MLAQTFEFFVEFDVFWLHLLALSVLRCASAGECSKYIDFEDERVRTSSFCPKWRCIRPEWPMFADNEYLDCIERSDKDRGMKCLRTMKRRTENRWRKIRSNVHSTRTLNWNPIACHYPPDWLENEIQSN